MEEVVREWIFIRSVVILGFGWIYFCDIWSVGCIFVELCLVCDVCIIMEFLVI